jgi:hypothetical protein
MYFIVEQTCSIVKFNNIKDIINIDVNTNRFV